MNGLTRRDALSSFLLGSAGFGAALATGCVSPRLARATPAAVPTAATASGSGLAGAHHVVPLPFAAGSLHGLSERLMLSHYENNYAGAVRNLNRAEQELAHMTAETPPFVVAAVRERELTFRNSKTLHEAYFGNLGGDGRRAGAIDTALAQTYGGSARWEEHFRATGLGLGGGSGWVVLALELETSALRTVAMANHAQALAMSVPLVVMDMYEHSYQMDFGAAVPRYMDAFFANLQWDEVNARFDRATKAALVVRGT